MKQCGEYENSWRFNERFLIGSKEAGLTQKELGDLQ
jgi:hypothetical protein